LSTSLNLGKHIIRRAVRSIWENLYLNAVSAGVIGASLLLLGVYASVQDNLNSIVDTWNRDVHISAYFASDITESERLALRQSIHSMPEAVQVRYVSEEDARDWLISKVEGIENSLDVLGADALPASLEITLATEAAQPSMVEAFAEKIERPEFENIDYGVEWVEKFNAFLQLLQALGTLLGLLILLAATFLVTNTVHLVVYNRKSELEIAKLVGASNSFIMMPFLLEGAAQGLVGALGSIAGLWVIHETLAARIQSSLSLKVAGELKFIGPEYLLLLTCLGVTLGILAAFIATKSFLGKTP
jgi:cell division transport system permease protein